MTLLALGVFAGAFFKGHDGILFMVALGAALAIHEVGHWIAATFLHLPVASVQLGVGTRLFWFRRKTTQVHVCTIPLLGWVAPGTTTPSRLRYEEELRKAGRDGRVPPPEPEPDLDEKPSSRFELATPKQQMGLYLSGVAFNLVAAVLFFLVFGISEVAQGRGDLGGLLNYVWAQMAWCANGVLNIPSGMLEWLQTAPKPSEARCLLNPIVANPWTVLHVLGFVNCLTIFLNLLPIPALDGFQFLVAAVEWVRGKRIGERVKALMWKVGLFPLGAWVALNVFLALRDAVCAISW